MQAVYTHSFRSFLILFAFVLFVTKVTAQVTCPNDIIICQESSPISLSGAQPTGGVYSGPGVSSGIFDPKIAGVGTHQITYLSESTTSCTFNIQVVDGSIPRPFTEGFYCLRADTVQIVPYIHDDTPPFGTPPIPDFTWTGPGVIEKNKIDLSSIGNGFHTYIATIPNSIGCPVYEYRAYMTNGDVSIVSCTPDMEVDLAAPEFIIPRPQLGGSDTQDGKLLGYPSSFGDDYFLGNGANLSFFNPSEAGLGVHTITYFLSPGCELPSLSCQFKIEVTTLPVTLRDFKVLNIENKANLTWETTVETNFDHFVIERSVDPRSGFKAIHQMHANFEKKYQYQDPEAPRGLPIYYQLKMVDRDGTYAYGNMEWTVLDGVEQLIISPNPASASIQLKTSSQIQEVSITDLNGSTRLNKKFELTNNPEINVSNLHTGVYILRAITSNGLQLNNKLVVK